MTANCDECGKSFRPKWTDRPNRFCSLACYHASRQPPLRVCEECGTEFRSEIVTQTKGVRRRQILCSAACRNARSVRMIRQPTFNHFGRLDHGMYKSREYVAYHAARQRCNNPNANGYSHYGGRGIEFRFASFVEFYAELGPRPSRTYSVDRINNDGHYEPGNVRWATKSEQVRNRRAAISV